MYDSQRKTAYVCARIYVNFLPSASAWLQRETLSVKGYGTVECCKGCWVVFLGVGYIHVALWPALLDITSDPCEQREQGLEHTLPAFAPAYSRGSLLWAGKRVIFLFQGSLFTILNFALRNPVKFPRIDPQGKGLFQRNKDISAAKPKVSGSQECPKEFSHLWPIGKLPWLSSKETAMQYALFLQASYLKQFQAGSHLAISLLFDNDLLPTVSAQAFSFLCLCPFPRSPSVRKTEPHNTKPNTGLQRGWGLSACQKDCACLLIVLSDKPLLLQWSTTNFGSPCTCYSQNLARSSGLCCVKVMLHFLLFFCFLQALEPREAKAGSSMRPTEQSPKVADWWWWWLISLLPTCLHCSDSWIGKGRGEQRGKGNVGGGGECWTKTLESRTLVHHWVRGAASS